jgi:hypothetical protein
MRKEWTFANSSSASIIAGTPSRIMTFPNCCTSLLTRSIMPFEDNSSTAPAEREMKVRGFESQMS